MSEAKKKGRVRDKWRLKTWYTFYAPPYFGGNEIAMVPGIEESTVRNRIVETTLYDLTKQDIQQVNVKAYFQAINVQGNRVDTVFKGHEYSREYLRSLVRRGSSRIDGIYDVKSRDGFLIRVYGVACSRRRLKPARESAIRKIMLETLNEKASSLNFDQFVQEIVLGKIASDVYNRATKIAPLRHVGMRKSRLLAMPPRGGDEKPTST